MREWRGMWLALTRPAPSLSWPRMTRCRLSRMERSIRKRGATIAAGLWLPVAALLLMSADPRAVALAVAGLIVAPANGWFLALQAHRSSGLGAATALSFAVASVASGACVWGLIFALMEGKQALDALVFAAVGLIFLGIPLLVLGTLGALAWIPLVRRAAPA